MTYINLSAEAGYTEQYTASLFIPHTDLGYLPRSNEEIKQLKPPEVRKKSIMLFEL